MRGAWFWGVCVLGMCWWVCGQSHKVQAAYNYWKFGQLDKALQAIEEAYQHPDSKDMPKTHYYRGKIYMSIYASKDKAFDSLRDTALIVAYHSFRRVLELGSKKIDLDEVKEDIKNIAELMISNGIEDFNNGKYQSAHDKLLMAYNIKKESLNIIDTVVLFYAGHSVYADGKYDVAVQHIRKAYDMGYRRDTLVYYDLAISYTNLNQYEQASEIVVDYLRRYPGGIELPRRILGIYYTNKKYKEALDLINKVLGINRNAQYMWLRSKVWSEMGQLDSALADLKRALSLDSNYFNALYDMGAIYFNEGVAFIDSANNLPINKLNEINALMEKANERFRMALPYMEKAHNVNPADQATIEVLLKLYARLDMKEKYDSLKAKVSGSSSH